MEDFVVNDRIDLERGEASVGGDGGEEEECAWMMSVAGWVPMPMS